MASRGLFLLPLLAWVCPAAVEPAPPSSGPSAAPTSAPASGSVDTPPATDAPVADVPTAELPVQASPPAEFVPAEPMPPASPAVSGFPQHDPRREHTLWGSIRAGEVPVQGASRSTGTWTTDGTRLAPSADGRAQALWFSTDPDASLTDGLVRARVEVAGALDASVLFRQQVADDALEPLSGYGLSITGGVVRLFRWDRGMALPIGQKVELGRSLAKRKHLEIVVFLVGPQVLANVYDGDTLEYLVTASAHDTTYAAGRVGLRVGSKHEASAAFTFLSVMDSARDAALAPATTQRRYGMAPPSDSTPFGNTRYAWIRSAQVDRLPKPLRRQVRTRVADDEGERALIFLDVVEYERLLRRGVEVLEVDSNAPWSAFDSAFRRRADEPPRRRGRGFVLDDSYKDPRLVEQLLRAYHERYPAITKLVEIGRSRQDRPIWALKISDAAEDPDEPPVLFNAAHHGSELLSIEYVLDAVDSLLAGYHRDPRVTKWIDGLEIWCVPMINVDGNHMFIHESRFATRKNAYDADGDGVSDPFEGVDINRNYPFGWGGTGSSGRPTHKWYRGPEPGSEPETQAMMRLAESEHFAAVLSFHTLGTDIYSPYVLEGARNPSPDVSKAIGQEIAAATPEQPNERSYAVRKAPYAVAGNAQDWFLHEHGSIALGIEGSHHNPELELRTEAVIATRPLWQALLDRLLAGPAIGGHVRDSAGNPVAATVMVESIETFADEQWRARARDGRFDRPLTRGGTHRLIVTAPGREPFTQVVAVGSRRVEVDIVVPDA